MIRDKIKEIVQANKFPTPYLVTAHNYGIKILSFKICHKVIMRHVRSCFRLKKCIRAFPKFTPREKVLIRKFVIQFAKDSLINHPSIDYIGIVTKFF